MNKTHINVFAPATIANVGPGFDVLGLAIDQPGDIVTATKTAETGLRFHLASANSTLPNDKQNVAACVARLILAEFQPNFGIDLTLHKKMPIGSGLGSSGASAAAAVFAVNALMDKPLSKSELVAFAAEGERLASGTAHADNVAPSLLGGLCLIRSYEPLDVIQLPYKNIFYWIVAHPNLVIETKMARSILPKKIPLTLATAQSGNLAGLITGLSLGDADMVAKSLHDYFAEPKRSALIPGYDNVKAAVMRAGALGFSLSGSGPALFAVSADEAVAEKIKIAFKSAIKEFCQVDCHIYCSRINETGAHIIAQQL